MEKMFIKSNLFRAFSTVKLRKPPPQLQQALALWRRFDGDIEYLTGEPANEFGTLQSRGQEKEGGDKPFDGYTWLDCVLLFSFLLLLRSIFSYFSNEDSGDIFYQSTKGSLICALHSNSLYESNGGPPMISCQ